MVNVDDPTVIVILFLAVNLISLSAIISVLDAVLVFRLALWTSILTSPDPACSIAKSPEPPAI